MSYRLDRAAFHYVDKGTGTLEPSPVAEDLSALDADIHRFLIDRVLDVRDAEEQGRTSAARFAPESDDDPGPPIAKDAIGKIISADGEFYGHSVVLAQRLFDIAPKNASPGLLSILRLEDTETSRYFCAVLKITHKDESFVRMLRQKSTRLRVERLKDLLEANIQKGAIAPHPERKEYHLKVIDRQSKDPAEYFIKFLGCSSKKSDEHQVKRMLPVIAEYANAKQIPLDQTKLPRVIGILQEHQVNINTNTVAETIKHQEVFGPDFDLQDFVQFVEKSSDVGPIDIPIEQFKNRGKKKPKSRMVTYTFKDPAYPDLKITGPYAVLEGIVSAQNDKLIFRIETTRNGVEVEYE